MPVVHLSKFRDAKMQVMEYFNFTTIESILQFHSHNDTFDAEGIKL